MKRINRHHSCYVNLMANWKHSDRMFILFINNFMESGEAVKLTSNPGRGEVYAVRGGLMGSGH